MIKLVLIALGLLSLVAYFRLVRSILMDRLIALILFVALSLLVVFPEMTIWVAHRLGVVRGTDLILYLYMVGSTYLFVLIYARNTGQEARITALVRALALHEASAPICRSEASARTSHSSPADTGGEQVIGG